jgi:hypothetical protein
MYWTWLCTWSGFAAPAYLRPNDIVVRMKIRGDRLNMRNGNQRPRHTASAREGNKDLVGIKRGIDCGLERPRNASNEAPIIERHAHRARRPVCTHTATILMLSGCYLQAWHRA